MPNCLSCGKEVKNKYCNVSCQNRQQNAVKADKKFGPYTDFNVKCVKCNIIFVVTERAKTHPRKSKYFCSRTCANSRTHSVNPKKKLVKG